MSPTPNDGALRRAPLNQADGFRQRKNTSNVRSSSSSYSESSVRISEVSRERAASPYVSRYSSYLGVCSLSIVRQSRSRQRLIQALAVTSPLVDARRCAQGDNLPAPPVNARMS